MPGWKTSIENIRAFNDLPQEAKDYVLKIQELLGVPGLFHFSIYIVYLNILAIIKAKVTRLMQVK